MKRVVAIVLIFVIGWNVGQEAFFQLWYQVANGSFTERFCINVAQPELMCHGKCQLQELAEEKKEQPPQNTPTQVLRFNYLALVPGHFLPNSLSHSRRSPSFHFLWIYDFSHASSLFRPPPLFRG